MKILGIILGVAALVALYFYLRTRPKSSGFGSIFKRGEDRSEQD